MISKPSIIYVISFCIVAPVFQYFGNLLQSPSVWPLLKHSGATNLKPSFESVSQSKQASSSIDQRINPSINHASANNDQLKASITHASAKKKHRLKAAASINHELARPALSDLIGDNETNITGDVQFLLDFAIIGHAKTSTTTLMNRLARHEQVQMKTHEVRSLQHERPAELVGILYDLPSDKEYKRGYKSPGDVVVGKSLRALQTYWPKTNLIVGVRHPVKWFGAWYNFKLRCGHDLPPAEKMVGDKLPRTVLFHVNLAQMGKTKPRNDAKQLKLLGQHKTTSLTEFRTLEMTNKVFLYDVSQPFDANKTLAELYTKDLTNFIGLSTPLPPLESKPRREKAVNICDDKYSKLRAELVEIGKAASDWIGNYFIEHPDVTVSSPDNFKKILKTWRDDPCINSHHV